MSTNVCGAAEFFAHAESSLFAGLTPAEIVYFGCPDMWEIDGSKRNSQYESSLCLRQ